MYNLNRFYGKFVLSFSLLLLFIVLSFDTVIAQSKPIIRLPKPLRGTAAIRALGDKLPLVAKQYKMEAKELRKILRNDRTLVVDKNARLHYEDIIPPPNISNNSFAAENLAQEAPFPLESTFLLHSMPNASKKIFLDFDGHTTTGTWWNQTYTNGTAIVSPAFSIDSDPSFNDLEKERIQGIWKRVAEDFAPFQVDVTTEDPGVEALKKNDSSDTLYGIRVVIGGSYAQWYPNTVGGVAYIGSFNLNSDTPCFAFSVELGNNEKYMADGITHEIGHTLGLTHDGRTSPSEAYFQGHGDWAPIMGVVYYKNIGQWSKGEYNYANNTQDDLSIIPSYGPTLRIDDHGGSISTATTIATASTAFSVEGIIASRNDIDVFQITIPASTLTLSVISASLSPNLNISLEIKNSSGQTLSTINPVGTMNAGVNGLSLPAGTYYIYIDGAGEGNPLYDGYSDYGSLGQYTLSGSLSGLAGPIAPAAVAQASTTSGFAPLTVGFTGSNSYDLDGSIVSYNWNFGDGATSSLANPSHIYETAGNYSVLLTVTDNTGLTGTANINISVQTANALPVASFIVNATSGTAPITITFDGSGSTDSDGTINSYYWDFGDGTNTTTTTPNISHQYTLSGNFNARLTVTDNRGGQNVSTATVIQIASNPSKTLRVSGINLSINASSNRKTATAVVAITNLNGTAIPGAKITGSFSGAVTGTVSGSTLSDGKATLVSKRFTKSGTVTFTVSSVSLAGYVYSENANIVVSASR
jgi:PKD repeat protein